MKVLFISSGNNKYGVSPIIKNQGESLKKEGVELEYFTIKGKGIKGYLKAIFQIKKHLKENSYDIIHAHYWLSGITASLAGAKPLVVSLMGDDVKAKAWFRWIIFIFHTLFWSKTIVKSKDMYNSFAHKNVVVIPNGVDLEKFKPINKDEALKVTNWDRNKKHILFTSNPKRYVKNYKLAKDAFDYLNDESLELHSMVNIPNDLVPYYYNSADVVVMTSHWEGSPNAIKEAMACNVPIVSTDVGDVKEIISNTNGCYIASYDYKDFASKIKKALEFAKKTNGRDAIKSLDSKKIAKKILGIYKSLKDK